MAQRQEDIYLTKSYKIAPCLKTLMFSACQIKSCYSQPEGFEKKDF